MNSAARMRGEIDDKLPLCNKKEILQNLLIFVNNLPIFEFFNLGFFAYDDKIKNTKTTKKKTMKNFKRIKWKMRKKTSVTFLHLSSACILLQITVQCEITRRRRKKRRKKIINNMRG